jgi:hypothetical protein
VELAIPLEGFENRRLAVQTGGLVSGPKVVIDGAPAPRQKGTYFVRNNRGEEVQVKLKPGLLDPVPRVEIAGQVLSLAKPLTWFEYVWMALPIALVFIGGALGGLCGASAVYASARVFRGGRSTGAKFAISGAYSLAAFVVWFVLAVAFNMVVR